MKAVKKHLIGNPWWALALAQLLASSAQAGIAERVVRSRIQGVDVIAYRTAVKDVVTINGSLPAGDAFADPANPDVATLAGMMLDKGTTTADKFSIAQQLESVGASIGFGVGTQTLTVTAKCLSKDAPAILRLIVEQLRSPALPSEELVKAKKQLAGALQHSLEDTDARAADAFALAVYPSGHPNRPVPAAQMLAAVERVTIDDVRAFHRRFYGPAHMTLVIVGDIDTPKLQSELQHSLAGWSGGAAVAATNRVGARAAAADVPVAMADKSSVSIVIGQTSGLQYSDGDMLALRVGSAVLGSGFTSRLMSNVRDKQGLTYGIGSYLDNDTFVEGDWRIYGSFAPNLLEKGLTSTRRELQRWWQDGITGEELQARKTNLIGSYKVGLASTDAMAGAILRAVQRGKPLSWLDDYPRAVAALTLEQVNAAIRRHLNPATMVVVEAGTLPATPGTNASPAAVATNVAAAAGTATLSAESLLSAPVLTALRRSRILVLGGSGRNGSAIVAALEALGARPQALTRDIDKARVKLGEHAWVQGDVTRPATLAAAFRGVDIVIDAAATSSLDGPNGTEAVDREGTRNVVMAARQAGVKRLVAITGMMVGAIPANGPPPMMKVLGAKRDGERLLVGSGIPYVILRPTGILDRPAGSFAVALTDPSLYHPSAAEMGARAPSSEDIKAMQEPPPGTISRADLALVTALVAVDRAAANKTVVVTQLQPALPARADWNRQMAAISAVSAATACKDAAAALGCAGSH